MRALSWLLSLTMLIGNFIPHLWIRLLIELALGILGAIVFAVLLRRARLAGAYDARDELLTAAGLPPTARAYPQDRSSLGVARASSD
jgi:hypothetical protein